MSDTELDKLDQALAQRLDHPKAKPKRTIPWRCYVTPDEDAYLRQLTEGASDRAQWMRDRLLGTPLSRPRHTVSVLNRQTYQELMQMRKDIHQIIQGINAAQTQGQATSVDVEMLNNLHHMNERLSVLQQHFVQTNRVEAEEDDAP